jgi:hypothetical protein
LVPSERVIVPRSADIAPPEAPGLPVVVSGGQTFAHAPAHADLPFLSASKRYKALPEGPTRYLPAELLAVFTITLVADAFVEDGVELAACVEECELELPHAATTRATPTPRTLLA